MAARRHGLASARKAAGFTQESLAAELDVDRTTVIRWESGENEPQPFYWPRLTRLLGISAEELRRLLADRPLPVAPVAPAAAELLKADRPVLDRRAVLLGTAAAALMLHDAETLRRDLAEAVGRSAMSDASLDDWEHTVFQYQLAHQYRPAASLLADLTADFAELQLLLQRRRAILVPTRLTRVVAQMAGFMSANLLRLDQQVAARNWARTAKSVANDAGDNQLHAAMLSQEAYSYYYDGKVVEAAFIAANAQHIAKQAACSAVATTAALEARIHAMHGKTKETHAALERTERALSRLDTQDRLRSLICYNEAKFAHHTGNAHTQLRRTADAFRAQDRALALYPPGDSFNRALVTLDRAECHLHDDDIPAAVDATTQALNGSTGDRNPVIDNRARQIIARIPASAATLPAVQELRDLLHTSH